MIATGAVGVSGIAATFFAPAWTQREVERRRENRAFRRARRLVAQELAVFAIVFENEVENSGPPTSHKLLNTNGWDAEKTVLAESLSDELWLQVATAYAIIERALALLDMAVDANQSLKERGSVEIIRSVVADAKAAAEKLRNAQTVND